MPKTDSNKPNDLKDLLVHVHQLVEANERKRITQPVMAQRIGVSSRTYIEYQRGVNSPLAMKALLNLLGMLEDQQICMVVREWNSRSSQDISG